MIATSPVLHYSGKATLVWQTPRIVQIVNGSLYDRLALDVKPENIIEITHWLPWVMQGL